MNEMSDNIRERVEKWLSQLDETEQAQAELLDSYFTFRRNLPEEDPGMGRAVEEFKTTDDIIDDLTPMMTVFKDVVVGWMLAHDYHITTMADGTPRWAIWRFTDVTVLS